MRPENGCCQFVELYASKLPQGTVNVQAAFILEKAILPKTGGTTAKEVTEVRFVQPLKAEGLISVTPVPMVTEVRPLQSIKASSPMELTVFGMLIEFKDVHSWNMSELNSVSPEPIVTEVTPE